MKIKLSNSLEINDNYCSYNSKKIKQVIIQIQEYLIKENVTNHDYLVWRCENTALNAIVIIYFLTHNYSFLLLNSEDKTEIPIFCRYILKTSITKTENLNLEITTNHNWNSKKANPKSPYLYVRTSGTTGKPKLIAHTHDRLWQNASNCISRLQLNHNDRLSLPVPIFHLFGLGAGLLPAILVGASVDLQHKANILTFIQREKKFEPNIVFMTPSFAQTLLKARKSPRIYRFTVIAGDRLLPDTFNGYEAQFGMILPLYGSSEMGVIAIADSSQASIIRQNTVGQPLDNVEVKLAQTQVKELCCLHQYGFVGYLDEEGNWLSDNQNKWFATKDIAEIDTQGNLTILGRCDDCVNRDGLLVVLTQIDKTIESITDIEKAITVAVGETERGKRLKTYCQLKKQAQLTAPEIRSTCFDLLPRRAIPDEVVVVSSLPLLTNGKIDRLQLKSLPKNK